MVYQLTSRNSSIMNIFATNENQLQRIPINSLLKFQKQQLVLHNLIIMRYPYDFQLKLL